MSDPVGRFIWYCCAEISATKWGNTKTCGAPATHSKYGMDRCDDHEIDLSPCTWSGNLDPLTGYCRRSDHYIDRGDGTMCRNPEPAPEDRPESAGYAWCFDHGDLHKFDGQPWCTARWVPLRGLTEEEAFLDKLRRFPRKRRNGELLLMRFFAELPAYVQEALVSRT